MSDAAIRSLAKRKPMVLLNRTVSEVPSVMIDNVHAIKKAAEHLTGWVTARSPTSPGPRRRGRTGCVGEACGRLVSSSATRPAARSLPSRPCAAVRPQRSSGCSKPTTAVIAYNDLMAIGFVQAVTAADRGVPADVSVIGFDNIVDGTLLEPHLTTIAAPLVSLGSAAVARLVKSRPRDRRRIGGAGPAAGAPGRTRLDRSYPGLTLSGTAGFRLLRRSGPPTDLQG